MNIEQMKAEIRRAYDVEGFSQRAIDNTGRALKKLLSGAKLKDCAIERMYNQVVEIRRNGTGKNPAKVAAGKASREKKKRPTIENHDEITRLQSIVERLTKENIELKERLQGLTADKQQPETDEYTIEDKPHGFNLRLEESQSMRFTADGQRHDKTYKRYYARRAMGDKAYKIYLGNSLDKSIVDEKIQAYCRRRGIELPE